MRKVLLVVNPASGRGEGGLARARCLEALAAAGVEVDMIEIPGPGQTARAVGEHPGADYQALVAAGGDGTVREVAEVAARLELPLGILPLGTSNSVARELGLPLEPVAAARALAAWHERTVDMAEAGGVRFLLCWSAGFDAEVVRRVHRGRRHGTSKLAYVTSAAAALATYPRPGLEAVADGVPLPAGAFQVVVTNARFYGGYFQLAREAAVDDGLLDVCLFYGGRWSLLRQALRAFRKLPLLARPERHRGAGAIVLRAREVFVPGPPSAPTQIDGDVAAGLPQRIRVLPRALRVLVP